MKKINAYFSKLRLLGLCVACLAITAGKANATIYTAILSGSFSSTLTWGGIVPGSLLSSDIIIIPAGIDVSLTSTETFSGSASLTVDGSLTGGALVMTGGTLSGSGTISVDSAAFGLTSGFTFTGDLTAGALTSTGTTISGTANIVASNSLHLMSGTLDVAAGNLTLGNNSTITRSGGSIMTSGSGMLGLDSVYNVSYTIAATTGMELGGSGLHDIMVNIPSGTVTLAANTAFNGMMTLTSGTLALNGYMLTFGAASNLSSLGSGMLSGSSSSSLIINSTAGLTGALHFASGTGSVLHDLTLNTSGSAMLATDLSIENMLTLTSGTLSLNGHTLTINASGDVAGTGTGTLSGSSMSNLVINATGGLTGALNFAGGSGMLNNLTLNTATGGATMGSDLTLNGMLTLTSGMLTIGGNTLTLAGGANISGSGMGSLAGSTFSNIMINTTGSVTGALTFATGASILNSLTVNMGSASGIISLGSDLDVHDNLDLQSGRLQIGDYYLTIVSGATVTGGSASSYVVTNGTGILAMTLAPTGTDSFMVGTTTNFAPIVLMANSSATTGEVHVNVHDGVMAGGTTGASLSATQSMVNATWDVSSTASTINYNMMTMWSAGMEVNGFNRTHAFISHFTGGAWDTQAMTSASTSGGMYSMTRVGITSLSPFAVTDHAITTSVATVAAEPEITIYPNPVANTLHFSNIAGVDNIHVSDITGARILSCACTDNLNVSTLPAGVYEVQFIGKAINTVQKFVKE